LPKIYKSYKDLFASLFIVSDFVRGLLSFGATLQGRKFRYNESYTVE